MQPTAQTGIVWKISIFLFILLVVVLYKMNDYFKQEKYSLAQTQLRAQIVSLKTSISSQISTLKNVLSSYEYDLSENRINWVQLDPFFGIAKAERVGGRNSNNYRITQFIGRSGSVGANWNAPYLQQLLSHQVSQSDQPITVQVFRDPSGAKLISLRFANPRGSAVVVVGAVEYFQKFFDLSRGGRITALLETSDNVIAAHSEADYLGTLMPENVISKKKFLFEREEIVGTNLIAMNLVSLASLAKGFAVPWSVVGLIFGFGFLIVGVLIYTLDPIERRIEKYKAQEREQIFKETLSASLAQQPSIETTSEKTMEDGKTANELAASKNAAAETTTKVALDSASGQDPVVSDEIIPAETIPEVARSVAALTATDWVQTKLESLNKEEPVMPEVVMPLPTLPQPEDKTATATIEAETWLSTPNQSSSSSGTGAVVLDSSQVETFVYMPTEDDNLDLDRALSLDDIESEEVTQNSVQMVQEHLTSKTINTTEKISDMSKPEFTIRRKEFQVDVVDVPIRRPERT